MTSDTAVRTPWHLWVVGVVAILFNAIGVVDHSMTLAQGDAYMSSAGMTPQQIAHYHQMPTWMRVDWAIGVWSALIGSVLILLRRRLAFPIFVLSLAAYLISLLYTYVLSHAGDMMGQRIAITSAVITAFLLFFIWYSRLMARRGVLR